MFGLTVASTSRRPAGTGPAGAAGRVGAGGSIITTAGVRSTGLRGAGSSSAPNESVPFGSRPALPRRTPATLPFTNHTSPRASPAGFVTPSPASRRATSPQRMGAHLATPHPHHEQQPRDHCVDPAALQEQRPRRRGGRWREPRPTSTVSTDSDPGLGSARRRTNESSGEPPVAACRVSGKARRPPVLFPPPFPGRIGRIGKIGRIRKTSGNIGQIHVPPHPLTALSALVDHGFRTG